MKKGDDTVEIEPVSAYVGQQRSFDIDLKEGNDHFTFVSPTVPEGGGATGAQQVDPTGADITKQTRGKVAAYLNGWRFNGERWQVFDHHLIQLLPDVGF